MTGHRDLDPLPREPWRETSDADHRAWVREVTAAHIRRVKDARKKPIEETQP